MLRQSNAYVWSSCARKGSFFWGYRHVLPHLFSALRWGGQMMKEAGDMSVENRPL